MMTKLLVLNRRSLLICLLVAVGTPTRTNASVPNNQEQQPSLKNVDQNCYSYGCPNYPRDVSFDTEARRALAKLGRRTTSPKSVEEGGLEEQEASSPVEEALEELKACGDSEKATMTMIGYKGGRMEDQINQDRSFVVSPFQIFGSNEVDTPISSNAKKDFITSCRLLGVFDGHGNLGEVVSEFAVKELPTRLASKLDKAFNETVLRSDDPELIDSIVKNALVESFVEIDKDVPTGGKGGCTASVILQLNSKLYIANAGDSVSFIAAYISTSDTAHVVYQSREDKPHLPDEKKRIQDMDGMVYIPSKREAEYGEVSRAYYVDKQSGTSYGLAMSRSIGDWDVSGVIADPIVDVLDIHEILKTFMTTCPAFANEGDDDDNNGNGDDASTTAKEESQSCKLPEIQDVRLFAVSATDGLMDFLIPSKVARPLSVAFFGQNVKHPLKACGDLVNEAAMGWHHEEGGHYRDDIAIAASKISLDQKA